MKIKAVHPRPGYEGKIWDYSVAWSVAVANFKQMNSQQLELVSHFAFWPGRTYADLCCEANRAYIATGYELDWQDDSI